MLIGLCRRLNVAEAYAIAVQTQQLMEESLSGIAPDSPEDEDRLGWGRRTGGRRLIGDFVIGYRNDIPLCRLNLEERLRYLNSLYRPRGWGSQEKIGPVDPAKERDTWPQPGWWRSEWDSILPPGLDQPQPTPTQQAAEQPEEENYSAMEEIFALMQETLDKIDEQRAMETRWLLQMRKALADAERKKADVRSTLRVLALEAQERRNHIARLRGQLKEIPESEGQTPLEDWLKAAIEWWDTDNLGEKPRSNRDVRRVILQGIAKLSQEHEALLRQQDQLIQETLDTYYGGIIREMENIGDKSTWDEIREATQLAKRDVSDALVLARAELYLASEQEEKFRAAAREAIELGRYEPQVRYMEACHFLSKKDLRHALHLFRQIAIMTAPPGQDPALYKAQETPEGGWLHDRSRKMVWTLEQHYLRAIDAKAAGEAANVRAVSEDRLKKGGEDGWWEWVKAHLNMGIFSASSAIVGREDALEGLASRFQQDVAAQHCGLLLIRSLHERGVPLDQIEKLDNQKFIEHVQQKYSGRRLNAGDALRVLPRRMKILGPFLEEKYGAGPGEVAAPPRGSARILRFRNQPIPVSAERQFTVAA